MIPLRLTLQNFLSYGSEPQTVDFSGYNLICLSGKNGHGKSALLDAITWATWGQARKTIGTTKADAGLIRIGQSKMMVIFELISAKDTYRVRRECTLHYGKTYATLDFALYDTQKQTFCPLTEKTLRKTQEKIEECLQLSYDSFCNSAFLRQGNSNEFSVKSPRDRKQIIASILGIDQYEIIRKEAQKRHRTLQGQLQTIDALSARLTEKQACENDLNQSSLQLAQALKVLTEKKRTIEHNGKITQKQSLRLQGHALTIAARIKNAKEDVEKKVQLLQKLVQIRQAWKETQKKRVNLSKLSTMQATKKELKTRIAQLQNNERTKMELERKRFALIQHQTAIEHQLQKKLQVQKEDHAKEVRLLEAELHSKNESLNNFEIHIQKGQSLLVSCAKKLDDMSKRRIQYQEKTALLKMQKHTLERYQKHYLVFAEREKALAKQTSTIIERLHIASGSLEQDQCPLCKQTLTVSQKRLIIQNNLRQASVLSHQVYRLNRICPTIQTALSKQTGIEQELAHYRALTAQLAATCTVLQETKTETAQQLAAYATEKEHYLKETHAINEKRQEKINHIRFNINVKQQQELQTCIAALKNIEKQIDAIEDLSTLPTLLSTLLDLENKLENACPDTMLSLQKQQLEQAQDCIGQIRKYHTSSDLLNQLFQRQASNVVTQNKTQKALQLYEISWNKIIKELQEITAKKERINVNIEALLESKREQETLHTQKEQITQQAADFSTIATALSKDGIQALLIEQTLPDIEYEANNILTQLTDNQTHIMIDSLKDLKKGGTKETLDIKISDEQGIRPYEMFSGGEAFRIDFALRIAISKLLAMRSGTQLETLIIDEGFGSQDAQGLSHIMDTLYRVQDKFSKIIIVSHLAELKDQFPVHFIVSKGPNGSTISVKKNG